MSETRFMARTTDPQTSHLAAANLNHMDMKPAEILILNILTGAVMTDEELVDKYQEQAQYHTGLQRSPSAIRTLRVRMYRDDLVACVGLGKSSSGNTARLWTAKEL